MYDRRVVGTVDARPRMEISGGTVAALLTIVGFELRASSFELTARSP